jgi:DNA-binding HxlR family transcriptional regulator
MSKSEQNQPIVICPVETFLNMISNKWKVEIVWHLLQGKQRFGELHRKVVGINQKVLTDNLRDMERDGLVTRTVYAEIPPRVEYELSPLGESMRDVLNAVGDWGMWYLKERYPEEKFLDCRHAGSEELRRHRSRRVKP